MTTYLPFSKVTDKWTLTTTDVSWCNDVTTGNYYLKYLQPPKRFNCKHCGAANQVNVCEYCGCAAESEDKE